MLIVLLFLIQPLLAVLALITVPLFFLLLRWLFRNERKLHARRYSNSRQMSGFLGDVLSGFRVVKAFSREQAEITRFEGKNRNLAESQKKLSLFTNYAWPMANLLLYLGNIIAWGVGGWMVIKGYGSMTYGLLLTFVFFFIFAGNMARIEVVQNLFEFLLGKSTLLFSILSCQIISNVPSAILLSQFTDNYRELLLGVNIGGVGTLIASLASLTASL